jgi:hypothetical protein
MLLRPRVLRFIKGYTLKIRLDAAVLILAMLLFSTVAHATLVDVQFMSPGGGPQGTAGTQFSGAALIGSAGDQWNVIDSAFGSSSLIASAGSTSAISLSYSATVVYGLASFQEKFLGTPYANLMQSFLVSHNGEAPMTLTFSGLSPGEAYALYVYGQSASTSYGETVTVNGATQTALQTNAPSFVENDNYLLFRGVANASGNITISDVTASGELEADLNGLQLDLVPEPASFMLFGVGIVVLSLVCRRHKVCRTNARALNLGIRSMTATDETPSWYA